MTIGSAQGSVWIGKPFDIVIPLTLQHGEAPDALCLEADVMQGDSRIDDKRVTVSLEPGASAGQPRMRVRSTVAINEPVVTATVRAGCDMKSSRRYVLLADMPVESALPEFSTPSRPAAVAAPGVPSTVEALAAQHRSAADSGFAVADRAPQPRVRPVKRRTVRRAAPAGTPVAHTPVAAGVVSKAVLPAQSKSAVVGASRLQLDPVDAATLPPVGLQVSPTLSLPLLGAQDLARRSEAAALWRSIGGATEDKQGEALRLQSLEATLATLREQTAQNQRTLLEMRSELVQARQSRYRNPLVYALAALLLLVLIATALLWRLLRRAASPAWWGGAGPGVSGAVDGGPGAQDVLLDEHEVGADAHIPSVRQPLAEHGAALHGTEVSESGWGDPESDSVYDTPRLSGEATISLRPVNTEELFDVQQQSDFFLSLGQHDEAIAVLDEHIATNPDTSALAYLDLFSIFHSLGRREDYARLRRGFEGAFNAEVPEFDAFTLDGRGLERYRGALARIESQWPGPSTLALIEELVFRKPGTHEEVFDLAAYRELLMLYALAKEVIDPDNAPPAPVTPLSFSDTSTSAPPTTPAALLAQSVTAAEPWPTSPPSIFGALERRLQADTVLTAPPDAPDVSTAGGSVLDLNIAEFDGAAFDTRPAALSTPLGAVTTLADIELELFDPAIEAKIAPRPPARPESAAG